MAVTLKETSEPQKVRQRQQSRLHWRAAAAVECSRLLLMMRMMMVQTGSQSVSSALQCRHQSSKERKRDSASSLYGSRSSSSSQREDSFSDSLRCRVVSRQLLYHRTECSTAATAATSTATKLWLGTFSAVRVGCFSEDATAVFSDTINEKTWLRQANALDWYSVMSVACW